MAFSSLLRLTSELDDRLRFVDFGTQRTVGGLCDRVFKIRRHTLAALILPFLLIFFLFLASPSLQRMLWALPVAIIFGAVICRLMQATDRKERPVRVDLVLQVATVLACGVLIWVIGGDQYDQVRPYRHILVPIAAAVAIALVLAAVFVRMLFRTLQSESAYATYLKQTELFASRGDPPQVTLGTISTALLTTFFRAPVALLTPPAIAALLARPFWLVPVTLTTFCLSWFAMFVAGLNERFGTMWSLVQEVFFKGGGMLVSIVVIALAAARLGDVSYVSTVFDGAAWWTIGVALGFSYVLSWWYDYWSNRLLAEEILVALSGKRGSAQIPYVVDANCCHTSVPADERVLQIHGDSRFIVIREGHPVTYFQSYTVNDLVQTLAISAAPGGKATPTPLQIQGRIYNFHALAALFIIVLLSAGALVLHVGTQLPEATVQTAESQLSLDKLLPANSGTAGERPLIVIAASGGGTRAAVYTASILEGIANLGRSADVVVGSGVSGGGAALAYYAANRPELIARGHDAWDSYFTTMKLPYIQDVLDRSLEWRIASEGRLGLLLKESFIRHWKIYPGRETAAGVPDMGLIFNTTLAGHLDCPGDLCKGECPEKQVIRSEDRNGCLREVEPSIRDLTKSTLAGGRLLLTNLGSAKELAGHPLEPGTGAHDLPVIISSPTLLLAESAALNANFPPVFPNAAIDVNNQTRYWVTDGGAADNRGMEMLLYMLRKTLTEYPADKLPSLYVVVADASAFSDGYTQDRGISSLVGAGSHFASHLDSELVSSIRALYGKHSERFKFLYVMMPDRLREAGSFGTHWMLQSRIKVRHKTISEGKPTTTSQRLSCWLRDFYNPCTETVTLTGDEMVAVLRALHTPRINVNLSPDACRVLHWSREDEGHSTAWRELVHLLGGSDEDPKCSTQ